MLAAISAVSTVLRARKLLLLRSVVGLGLGIGIGVGVGVLVDLGLSSVVELEMIFALNI